jgi:D-alanyl-D-alanine carboxypeptidase
MRKTAIIIIIAAVILTACDGHSPVEIEQTAASPTSEVAAQTDPDTVPSMTRRATSSPDSESAPSETATESTHDTTPAENTESSESTSTSATESVPEVTTTVNSQLSTVNCYEWALWLINGKNPLPAGYTPPTLSPIGGYTIDSRVAPYAQSMIDASRAAGISLSVISAYRGIERQTINFESDYNSARGRGMSREEAFAFTSSRIAIPGTSEHNAGLAIDFNTTADWFDQTAEFRWLRDNSWRYGFILRYPKDTTHITGIIYEPWHYRFVGLYHAEKIYNAGITLEEYMGTCLDDDSVAEAFKNQLINR